MLLLFLYIVLILFLSLSALAVHASYVKTFLWVSSIRRLNPWNSPVNGVPCPFNDNSTVPLRLQIIANPNSLYVVKTTWPHGIMKRVALALSISVPLHYGSSCLKGNAIVLMARSWGSRPERFGRKSPLDCRYATPEEEIEPLGIAYYNIKIHRTVFSPFRTPRCRPFSCTYCNSVVLY